MRFILVDRILRVEKGKEGLFLKNVSQSEDFFADHFPGEPIMPGALILEAFDQASQLLISFTHDFSLYPKIRRMWKANFKHFVVPGDQLHIFLSLAEENGAEVQVKAEARSRDRLTAQAVLEFTLVYRDFDAESANRCRRLEDLYHLLSSDPVLRGWETLAQQRNSE